MKNIHSIVSAVVTSAACFFVTETMLVACSSDVADGSLMSSASSGASSSSGNGSTGDGPSGSGETSTSASSGSGAGGSSASGGGMSGTGGSSASGGGMSGTGGGGTTGPCTGSAQDIAVCKQQAQQQMVCAQVADCGCDHCVCQLAACELDAGCKSIRQCAQRTGCTGAGCYSSANCKSEIDAAGGPLGNSAKAALAVSNCVTNANCPTKCP